MAKSKYPGCVEVSPGVYIDFDAKDPAIYIADGQGEVVMWTYDEVKEDPGAWTASLMGMMIAARSSPTTERVFLAADEDMRAAILKSIKDRG